MNHNFNAGDLALTIVHDVELPAYSVVQIESRIQKGDLLETRDWKEVPSPGAGWLVSREGLAFQLAYGDGELMPLRKDFAPEQQRVLEVVA
ncbi:hypothetical protein HK44_020535 [Pseudomonas fluorescens HK44]|uniref:Uncharacterized protein n=1 Tax=Pseudomonas fluorescens HK44 TaxID=1042209 RepID=A0A010SYJ8_PSEFL|nr:hypothetical protein [Pseudomonas fluorescens]EXF95783.1 hypothetical protein HK44_020535 [Pseudomonas fluorescens HK44]